MTQSSENTFESCLEQMLVAGDWMRDIVAGNYPFTSTGLKPDLDGMGVKR
jgi:hypothetical protein